MRETFTKETLHIDDVVVYLKNEEIANADRELAHINLYNEMRECSEQVKEGVDMKIYQIHECGDEGEYSTDVIVGTYFRKERAEEEMKKMKDEYEAKQEVAKICDKCPITSLYSKKNVERVLKNAASYCEKFQPTRFDDFIDCQNYIPYDYNSHHFKIEEVLVLR